MTEAINKEVFSTMVEEIKYRLKLPYLECIIYLCEHENIDLETVPKLLTKPLKKRIEEEAEELKLFKKVALA
ncbi:MAG: late promoter transcription accessory protein [Patescibacteria group bacterium]|nr:late promoter transcription accessory protein [Patescibacteria group bacterium]